MKALFLDTDGVLNTRDFNAAALCAPIHPEKVARLNRVLRATDARVVLSSSWRYLVHNGEMTRSGLEWLYRSHGLLADRLIGVTRPDKLVGGVVEPHERGRQVAEFVRWWNDGPRLGLPDKCRVFAAVDDVDDGFTAEGIPFLQTDGGVGLTDADADRLIELLGKL